MKKSQLKVMVILALAVVAVMGMGTRANAQLVPVDLELALLVDISGSVSSSEFNLQRQGYVDAFNNPVIHQAIADGQYGKIAATLIYWSTDQAVGVGWTLIDSATAAQNFATAISNAARPSGIGSLTAPGSAVNYATPLFFNNSFDGTRLVIDVSGDGEQNTGASTTAARDAAYGQGITINGIAIGDQDIQDWYDANLITPNGFSMFAANFVDFGTAIDDKLLTEIDDGGDDETVIPEPASLMLLGTGLIGLVGLRKKRS